MFDVFSIVWCFLDYLNLACRNEIVGPILYDGFLVLTLNSFYRDLLTKYNETVMPFSLLSSISTGPTYGCKHAALYWMLLVVVESCATTLTIMRTNNFDRCREGYFLKYGMLFLRCQATVKWQNQTWHDTPLDVTHFKTSMARWISNAPDKNIKKEPS